MILLKQVSKTAHSIIKNAATGCFFCFGGEAQTYVLCV